MYMLIISETTFLFTSALNNILKHLNDVLKKKRFSCVAQILKTTNHLSTLAFSYEYNM